MSMQDPIADMLTCIRNGQFAKKNTINIFFSKIKFFIVKVLKEEGYIQDFKICQIKKIKKIELTLKYFKGYPVIKSIKRVSKPGLRIYKVSNKLPIIMNGLGTAIISTSKGVMTDNEARKIKIGGEVICYIS